MESVYQFWSSALCILGFAFWNPITWIFAGIGYSVPILSVEILFYIWIAGITAFELGVFLAGIRKEFCFVWGSMIMSCGFFIGNLQHTNFLTCGFSAARSKKLPGSPKWI